jgi:hypothetical protein
VIKATRGIRVIAAIKVLAVKPDQEVRKAIKGTRATRVIPAPWARKVLKVKLDLKAHKVHAVKSDP